MPKPLSLPKIGVPSLLEQTFLRIFSPSTSKAGSIVNFVAPPHADIKMEAQPVYHSEAPSQHPKQRIKKENTFKLDEHKEIVSHETNARPEYSELKPEIKLLHTGFNVAINFANNFKLPAKIYCRRGFEKDFKFLALDTFSPYMDNRPKLDSTMSEEREYKVIFCDEEMEVGKMSEIVKITV